ncbi:topology modulation protein [Bacillus sp. DTU_2020_1000418_1_SI_GHA_SEK_038]|uniref:topology modulation protein n=1 Tax=Bacillus sp. DTU_2020_1000418_1_SI_GHA_SEK_038 TaxID=3077585 RepID=UPI0028EC0B87|nr:topology modulation protein [Bacillus sp. DTU_2020_1000418_1_SI_GHA_SEK_038]WNS75985.1 topology modulation protein [Bacillus sp. DTU_2020_1000418_1_SI_GHA_SEK_038]
MKRIMVVGISSGVGKSTFARKLGEVLDIHVYHLDALFWKPNWVEAPIDEFSEAQRQIVNQDQWIIEGNYTPTFSIRTERADTIIYLELPIYICLYRVLKRWVMNIGKTRPDMGKDCKEKIDWAFIKFILTTYYPRKKKMAERFQAFQATDSKKVILLINKQEIEAFLRTYVDK